MTTKNDNHTPLKDSIDFGSMHIPTLFRKLLIPTVLGMVFSAIFIITDGIFVGKGIGSDALAAVNITAPLFLINTGVALMFGIGASVVASIHLSHGKPKVARINVTQAVIVSSLLLIAYAAAILGNVEQVARLLGSSDRLLSLAAEYMYWFVPFLVFSALLSSGMFFVRLDGSPNYAMTCNIVAALINIFLDWLFIYVFRWGMFGAALATSLGYIIGALMILFYLLQRRHVIRLERIKLSLKSLRLTVRNVGYMMRLGLSTFLCEAAIATMMFVGNYVFIRYLGEDGVAAFSIACYFFPIIFMVYNAIAQSAQPILSYNYGAAQPERVRSAFRLALWTAVVCGVVVFLVTEFFTEQIVGMFVDTHYPAYRIAVEGLPLFAAGFVCFGVNIVSIGYFQSVERDRPAMAVTLLRGFILVLLCFWLMPAVMGVPRHLAGRTCRRDADAALRADHLLPGQKEERETRRLKIKRYGKIRRYIQQEIQPEQQGRRFPAGADGTRDLPPRRDAGARRRTQHLVPSDRPGHLARLLPAQRGGREHLVCHHGRIALLYPRLYGRKTVGHVHRSHERQPALPHRQAGAGSLLPLVGSCGQPGTTDVRTGISGIRGAAHQRRGHAGQGTLPVTARTHARAAATCTAEAHRLLSLHHPPVAEPHPCRTGPKGRR